MSPEGSSRIKDQKYQTRIKNGQVCLIVIKIGQLGSSLIKLEGQKNKFFKSEKKRKKERQQVRARSARHLALKNSIC